MTVNDIFKIQKDENISEDRLAELNRLKQRHAFRNMGYVVDFGIEWQKVTGKLLMSDSRTKEMGRIKLMDAKRREDEKKILKEKGVLR